MAPAVYITTHLLGPPSDDFDRIISIDGLAKATMMIGRIDHHARVVLPKLALRLNGQLPSEVVSIGFKYISEETPEPVEAAVRLKIERPR